MSNDVVFETVCIKEEHNEDDDKTFAVEEIEIHVKLEPISCSEQIKQKPVDQEGLDLNKDIVEDIHIICEPDCYSVQNKQSDDLYKQRQKLRKVDLHKGNEDIVEVPVIPQQSYPQEIKHAIALGKEERVCKARGHKTLVCSICNSTLSNQSNLKRHLKAHYRNRQLESDCCSEEIKQKQVDYEDYSVGKELDLYTDYKFKKNNKQLHPAEAELAKLENRKVRKVRKDKKPLDCNTCNIKFSSRATLMRHLDLHTGRKQFQCDLCAKIFLRKYSIIDHLHVHNGEKTFTCKICSRKFGNKPNLTRHLDVHIDKKKLKCNICNKRFERDLKLHLQTHYSDEPIACSICFKKFTTKCDLNFHLRLHKERKRFTCVTCNKKFTNKSNLNRHVWVHGR